MQTIETSTIYHTPSGDIEVPSPPITIPDVLATYESNLAPQYLVFPNHIFNMRHVYRVSLHNPEVPTLGQSIVVEKTWKALQQVFADGIGRKK
jgi:hypothetical protein